MRVLVAGGRGGVGRLLSARLAAAGHDVVATIRSSDHAGEVRAAGVEPVVLDVTGDVVAQLADAGTPRIDAVVYSIGAGPGSGPGPKQTVDRAGSDKLVAWAESAAVPRYVMVSSHGAHDPSIGTGDFVAYLEAKRQADERLAASSLDWTIVRPGRLTDEPAGGGFATPSPDQHGGSISRADVADFLAEVVTRRDLGGVTTELVAGDSRLDDVLAALAR